MQDYHNILVWRRAHALAIHVRRATQRMPRSGYGDLKTQITSAAESIPMNIVEGCGAQTRKEFARFLSISVKSCSELQYQLELAHGYTIIAQHEWSFLTREVIEVRKMLCGYRATVLQAAAGEARSASTPDGTRVGGQAGSAGTQPRSTRLSHD